MPRYARPRGTRPTLRFHIPSGAEHGEDAFISFASFVRMLEASADDLGCPDFDLRLSGRQGLHILGPLAVIARDAQTCPAESRRSHASSPSNPPH